MTTHTPSPWKLVESEHVNGHEWKTLVAGERNAIIANIYCPHSKEVWDTIPPNHREANARIMAAAPDLLEALEFVLDDWMQGWKPHETASKKMALDAIKKARGE